MKNGRPVKSRAARRTHAETAASCVARRVSLGAGLHFSIGMQDITSSITSRDTRCGPSEKPLAGGCACYMYMHMCVSPHSRLYCAVCRLSCVAAGGARDRACDTPRFMVRGKVETLDDKKGPHEVDHSPKKAPVATLPLIAAHGHPCSSSTERCIYYSVVLVATSRVLAPCDLSQGGVERDRKR